MFFVAFMDYQISGFQIHIAQFQGGQLRSPQVGGIQQLQYGQIAYIYYGITRTCLKQVINILPVKKFLLRYPPDFFIRAGAHIIRRERSIFSRMPLAGKLWIYGLKAVVAMCLATGTIWAPRA